MWTLVLWDFLGRSETYLCFAKHRKMSLYIWESFIHQKLRIRFDVIPSLSKKNLISISGVSKRGQIPSRKWKINFLSILFFIFFIFLNVNTLCPLKKVKKKLICTPPLKFLIPLLISIINVGMHHQIVISLHEILIPSLFEYHVYKFFFYTFNLIYNWLDIYYQDFQVPLSVWLLSPFQWRNFRSLVLSICF
jgi:hypothetical protein